MTKENKTSEQPTLQPQQPSAKEQKAKKSKRARWFFRLIILLILAGLASGIYHNLEQKKQQNLGISKEQPSRLFIAPKSSDVIPVTPDVIQEQEEEVELIVQPTDISPQPLFKTEKMPTDTLNNTRFELAKNIQQAPNNGQENALNTVDSAPQDPSALVQSESAPRMPQESVIEEVTLTLSDTSEAISIENEVVKVDTTRLEFTAVDALALRDNFLSEEPCGEGLRKLIMSNNQSSIAQQVIQNTSYFCLTTSNVHAELNKLFLKSKKEAFSRYYKEKDSRWKRRLKLIFISMVQIRDLNPTGSSVPDLLNRAQNALMGKNMALAIETLSKLPPNIHAAFTEFLQKTQNFEKAKESLDILILSYVKGA